MVSESHSPALLTVDNLEKRFGSRRGLGDLLMGKKAGFLHALKGVSLHVNQGEIVGVVGESGCGKSTLGKCIIGLQKPSSGAVTWSDGRSMDKYSRFERSTRIQMVFQDPYSSLNPRFTIGRVLKEALATHHAAASNKVDRAAEVDRLLGIVGLPLSLKEKFPHALSGGQRQRVSIARALAVNPELIIADEPVSALDASVQAQIINLFEEIRQKLKVAFLFVAHDLNVVKRVSDRVLVMYLGEIVEEGTKEDIFSQPRHPYTRALLSAIPIADPSVRNPSAILEGELPDPHEIIAGCAFSSRCPYVVDRCRQSHPDLTSVSDTQRARCIRLAEI
ncbi:ABC transporter ATP-binding protein [Advenella mimigardefordensis]|uniref:Oligopeptide ABC transporter ATP-binding protein n=1 Tax=Advenella mimigardefordensis (strain DSM 17166 / LMG 22922 / DPN7) TaxID=1247726 RepID=W0PFY7_ADVMD|nr:ABC transporter ATP-binding protein [Advenella mimigardefordensis]AHG65606.1 oligopeptide ABC transporter ATP-binding protein [Advenella mimigardefordensis DPN7]